MKNLRMTKFISHSQILNFNNFFNKGGIDLYLNLKIQFAKH